ncbi:MAG: methyltransferase domain-containing protein [archaeon]
MNQEAFWKVRAEKYNQLKWVSEPTYIEEVLSAGRFNRQDNVLDVGTGTGVIAHAVAPHVKQVIGLDISQDMLDHSNWKDNKYFIKGDIRNPVFYDGIFDKVTARMVFHHILQDTHVAMNECFRVLRKGGLLILSEGVPPSADLKQEYMDIFSLKEERLTFLEEDLIHLMEQAGFKNITIKEHIMNGFSVKNWLENSGLPQEKQDKIFEMHVTGSERFKREYAMKITNGDCLIKIKSLILIGEK